MTVYELTVHQPVEWITANQRLNRWRNAELVKAWRSAAALYARHEGLPHIDEHVRIEAWVHKRHGRAYDVSNWAPTAKACVDGLRDAGVLTDDSNRYVTGPDMRHGGKSAEPCLHLIITTTEGDQP